MSAPSDRPNILYIHSHDSGRYVQPYGYSVPTPNMQLLADQGPDILRAKGILDVAGEERRLVFQAVHMILEGDFQREWKDGDDRFSRMVFIGRNLDEAALKAGFEACAA